MEEACAGNKVGKLERERIEASIAIVGRNDQCGIGRGRTDRENPTKNNDAIIEGQLRFCLLFLRPFALIFRFASIQFMLGY